MRDILIRREDSSLNSMSIQPGKKGNFPKLRLEQGFGFVFPREWIYPAKEPKDKWANETAEDVGWMIQRQCPIKKNNLA